MGPTVFPNNVWTMIARFCCSILMHLQVEGHVRQGLSMMKYSINHRDSFRSPGRAFLLGLAQFLGGLGSEISCIVFLATQTTTMTTLTKFISLAFISKVDDFYAAALTMAHPLKQPSKPLDITIHWGDPETQKMPYGWKFLRFVYKYLRVSYCSFFYYFMPFLAVFASYANPESNVNFVQCNV